MRVNAVMQIGLWVPLRDSPWNTTLIERVSLIGWKKKKKNAGKHAESSQAIEVGVLAHNRATLQFGQVNTPFWYCENARGKRQAVYL